MEKVLKPNIQIMELAVRQLQPLLGKLVFVGGCATGLLVSDPAASPVRATKDVDAIVQVFSLHEYQTLSKQLRECGFREDTSEDAPVCRWLSDTVMLDIMPTDQAILGFGNKWYESAIVHSQAIALPSGVNIRMVSAPYFLLTKLDAFDGRGKGDFQMSHDIEDVIVLVDGRPELIDEIKNSPEELQSELAKRFSSLLNNDYFLDAIAGHLSPDAISQLRVPGIIDSLKKMSSLY